MALPIFADSIDPTCGTCQGSIYTLTYFTIGTDMYKIAFTIGTSGYSGGGTLPDDVAVKVSSANPTGVMLVMAPNGAGSGLLAAFGILRRRLHG
jgi:hypothetical protein